MKPALNNRYITAMNEPIRVFPGDQFPLLPDMISSEANMEPALDKVIYRYLLQPIGHFHFISHNIVSLTGHTQAEFYKTPNLWIQCLHPDDQPAQLQVLNGRLDINGKRMRLHKPGYGYIWLEQKVTIHTDDDGRPLAVEGECLIQDEDHVKRMSSDLSNPGITHLLDMAPVAISITSVESSQILFANKVMLKFLKYPLRELLEMQASELPIWAASDDRDAYQALKMSHRDTEPVPINFRDRDGSIKSGLVSLQLVPFQSQTCFMTIISDITEQDQATTKLKHEYETLSRLIENSPLSINVSDVKGNTVLWNRRSEQIFGWTAEEVLGKRMPFVEDYGDEAYARFWDSIRHNDSWTGTDVRLKCKDGSTIVRCMYNSPVFDQDQEMIGILGILADSTESGKAHIMQRAMYRMASATQEIKDLNALYRSIHRTLSTLMPADNFFIALFDSEQDLVSYPYYQDEFDPPPVPTKREHGLTEMVIRTGQALLVDPPEFEKLLKKGEVESVGSPSIDWLGVPLKIKERTFGAIAVQSYHEDVRFSEEHKELLEFVSGQVAMAIDKLRSEKLLRINENRYRGIVEDQTELICRYLQNGRLTFANQAFCDFFDMEHQQMLENSVFSLFPDTSFKHWSKKVPKKDTGLSFGTFENKHITRDGNQHWLQWKTRGIYSEDGTLVEIQSVGRDITEQEMRHREMALIAKITSDTRFSHSAEQSLEYILDKISESVPTDALAFSMYKMNGEGMTLDHVRGIWEHAKGQDVPLSQTSINSIFKASGYYLNNKLHPSPKQAHYELIKDLRAVAGIPLIAEEIPIGMLWIGKKTPITNDEVRLIQSVGNITANGLHRVVLFEKTQERLRRLTTLKTIDLAITSTVDLKVILDILMDQIVSQLSVDAASIWLYDPLTQLLEYRAGRGFQNSHFKNYRLRLGESHAGKVALERKREIVLNLDEISDSMTEFYRKLGEQFSSFVAIPLIAKGQVKGVLELFTKHHLQTDVEWFEFLDSLGSQAAIALDNATMFDRLQRSNIELSMAYDATIDGWARALEMRDQETIGHTRRVADLTVGLVKIVNDPNLDVESVRRGVMLHDIGKMGIPDKILLKKGHLSADEWKTMRMHPTYAYDMLHSVPNLRALVDIPYCHHERWDGTGYPRGLKGEEIPLAARIFTIVDVWDAIRSDRPYRPAWKEKRSIEYMLSESGKQFDPKLVALFIDNLPGLIKPDTGYPKT
ncbi:MAG: PAS domain S-box protein [Anaerolineaceae bacterium]|nr:PAS domain S-box protein [Anaerolineaceae bacterium]MBN2676671.1 PAS domain S-box protein [Anaerolineaceae bacterium]